MQAIALPAFGCSLQLNGLALSDMLDEDAVILSFDETGARILNA